MQCTRYDFAPIKARRTDEGFLVDSPVVARVGIQEYMNADGSIRRELRLPDEVFKDDSLDSFSGKVVTDDHPSEKVTAKNAKKLSIGAVTSKGRKDGDNVVADIVIHDAEAIDKIEKGGKRELSVGYSVVLDETPGEWNGHKYDAIQRDIKINHLALVKRGRAGNARLNMDGSDVVFINQDHEEISMSEKLVQVKLDNGITYDAAPEVVVEMDKLRADAANHQSKVDEAIARADKAQAEADALKAEVAKIEQIKADAYAKAKSDIEARAKLESVAKEFKVDCKDLDDKAIKLAVIKAVRGDADLSEKSDAYIDAAFDMAVEMRGDEAMKKQRVSGFNKDGKPVEKAGDKYRAYMQYLGKKD